MYESMQPKRVPLGWSSLTLEQEEEGINRLFVWNIIPSHLKTERAFLCLRINQSNLHLKSGKHLTVRLIKIKLHLDASSSLDLLGGGLFCFAFLFGMLNSTEN